MGIIDDFVALSEGTDVPIIFRKWIGVGMVAAALGRRTKAVMHASKGAFYPNFYIVLVAEPGVGKTIALSMAQRVMHEVPNVSLGPNKISASRLLTRLAQMTGSDEQAEKDKPPPQGDASIALFLDEFGSLVDKYDAEFMEMMSELWNSPSYYEYATQKRGEEKLSNVCINMVAGTQPSWFTEGFSPVVLEQGFPARLILVFSDEEANNLDPFSAEDWKTKRSIKDLAVALEKRTHMSGQFAWSTGAMRFYRKLHANEFKPIPKEPLLRHYNTRRHFHLAKLSLVVAASNHTRMVVTEDDMREAWEMLLEAEARMGNALISAGGNKHRPIELGVAEIVVQQFAATKKAVPESVIRKFLAAHVGGLEADQIINSVIGQKLVKVLGEDNYPFRQFKPGNALK